MNERNDFCVLHKQGLYSMSELCQRFGISRKTGYKWVARFKEGGPTALQDRSRAPHSCPHRTPGAIEQLLLEARRAHPFWGPEKLCAYLARRHPDQSFPAPSTVGDLLQRHGLIQGRRRRRKAMHPGPVPLEAPEANSVWTADFKGEFPTRDGRLCYPLTISDAHSRYLLACAALASTRQEGARPVFEQLFREYGLPLAMRTDNGVPFATQAVLGLSQLAVWWIKLGITPQRIRPGKPQENGRHERMHRTLKAETTRPPEADQAGQQRCFDQFRQVFNEERPHAALEQRTPASVYAVSPRPFPAELHGPEYPGHFRVRQVWGPGQFRFKSEYVFLSGVLRGESIGLEEIDEGIWSVYFYNVLLGRLDERDYRIHN